MVSSLPAYDARSGAGHGTFGRRVPVVKYDIDQNKGAADEAGVRSIPTFLIYVDGKETWRHSGEIDGEVLLAKVESFL